jgi:hypothetical protein
MDTSHDAAGTSDGKKPIRREEDAVGEREEDINQERKRGEDRTE